MKYALLAISAVVAIGGFTTEAQSIPISGSPVLGFETVDQAAVALMQRYGIPGMSLAISKGGRLVFARGYGYADVASAAPVNPDSLFRLASVSKPLTATAADKLVEMGKLRYETKAFSVLSALQPLPGHQEDPRAAQITVQELAMHESGWYDNKNQYIIPAADALGLPLPGTFEGLLRYVLGFPLDYDPGTQNVYCSFCYDVLGEVVQAASGMDYETWVRNVLKSVGLSQTQIGSHLETARLPGEVTYYTEPGAPLVPSIYSGLPPLVPAQYGGITVDWGPGSAAGAWVSNTMELLRLVASVTLGSSPAMFVTAPRAGWAFSGLPIGRGWEWIHNGGIPGTSTNLHILDDVAWCILTNTDYNGAAFISDFDAALRTFALGTTNWPSGDLFPQYLPGLRAVPIVTAVDNAASFLPGLASGAWITIEGQNLASTTRSWNSHDFVGDLLPTSLDGNSVTINGKSAYVSYISPTQLNVLAPEDPTLGAVAVQVTTAQGTSERFTATKQSLAPAFFVLKKPYVAAVHADGSYVGVPGLISAVTTTPAKPGETILLFGTGFGPTNPALSNSQVVGQAEPLVHNVTVTIGGETASVLYAGETATGLDQFNVVVPNNLPDGDAPVAFNVLGLTESGLLLSVRH